MIVGCGTCNKPINRAPSSIKNSKSGLVFCGHSCSQSQANKLRKGKQHYSWAKENKSYRHKAIVEYGLKCSNPDCPLEAASIKIPEILYDVDHIDSNRKNNQLSNLQVLCVYCHAVKTRILDKAG